MLAIYGAGGFALQILDTVEEIRDGGEEVCFVDDNKTGYLYSIPIKRPSEVHRDADYCIAISNGGVRKILSRRHARLRTVRASTSRVSSEAKIGRGSVLAHHTIVEAGSNVGAGFQGNIYSYVAHECVIGDFVTFAPRVSCNGNVHIEDMVYVGAGAIIRNGTPDRPLIIGKGATVGMGAVVTRDVAPGATVIGNPARGLD